jgi:hypothetical protein
LPQTTEGVEKEILGGLFLGLYFRCLTIEAAALLPGVFTFLLTNIAKTPDR